MAVNQAPRRITALANINTLNTETSEDLLNALQLPASSTAPTTEADRKHSPGKWYIAADYKQNTEAAKGDLWDDEGESDYGSVSIPISRIAMRDSSGIIPESMLPAYIDEIMFGTLNTSSASVTTFTVEEMGGTEKVFASPTQTGSQLVPPSNAIFYDNTTKVQYRWVEAAKDTRDGEVFNGFTPIPNSKTIRSNYGLEVSRNATETLIDAKKADFFTMYASAGPQEVGNSFTKFPFDSGTSKSENANLTVAASSDKVTVSNLIEGVRYMVNLQLSATPKTLSSNIIDVSFNCSTVPTQVQQMDMSGPSGAATKLNFVCSFRLNSGTTADLQIKAEEAINVTTTRFTIFELL